MVVEEKERRLEAASASKEAAQRPEALGPSITDKATIRHPP